jgi:HlyD family secretion protein
MKKRTKLGIGGVVVIALVGIAAASAMNKGRAGVAVRIEEVGERDLVAIVSASGWIEPHRKVDVQSDIMGRITELRVVEGQRVTRGEVLLRIDPMQSEAAAQRARAAVSEAQAREAQTRANLVQSERAYERMKAIAAQDPNLVSQQALEEAETQVLVQRELLQAAGHTIAQARAALGEAQDRLSKTVIRAPMDGVITRLNVEEGETAIVGMMNNPGSLLLTIADLSAMQAVVRVDETDVPRIAIGDSAVITIDAFRGQTLSGRVSEIGHSATRPRGGAAGQQQAAANQAVDFEIKITLDSPPPTLRSDLSMTAEIVTAMRKGALAIPIIALTVRESPDSVVASEDAAAAAFAQEIGARTDQEGVFVVRDGEAKFVPVQVGIAGRGHFEVLSGVAAGDSIVAGPYDVIRTLSDGRRVRAMPAAARGGQAGGASRAAAN